MATITAAPTKRYREIPAHGASALVSIPNGSRHKMRDRIHIDEPPAWHRIHRHERVGEKRERKQHDHRYPARRRRIPQSRRKAKIQLMAHDQVRRM